MSDLEHDLSERLHALDLPAAPASLRRTLDGVVAEPQSPHGRPGRWPLLLLAATVALGGTVLAIASGRLPNDLAPSPSTAALAEASPEQSATSTEVPSTSPPASPSPTGTIAPTPTVPATRPPADVALSYPDGCAAYELSPQRCAGIVDWALSQAGVGASSATVELLGNPNPFDTSMFVVRVRVTPVGSEASDHSVFCGVGGQYPLCRDTPEIRISTNEGYGDIPCRDDANGNPVCPSPVPSINPRAAANAEPLRIPSLTVPIDRTGAYVIDLGDAVLPNGILTRKAATLANDKRFDVVLTDGLIRFEVIGEDGQPLFNKYLHGWRPGTERVHARFVFTVESFDPGATLEITDIVLR